MNEWMNEFVFAPSYRDLSRGCCMSIICLLIQFSFKSTTETSECKAHVANNITRQHGPCWRVMETSHPSTRVVETELNSPSPYILLSTIPPITSFSDRRSDGIKEEEWRERKCRDFKAGCLSYRQLILSSTINRLLREGKDVAALRRQQPLRYDLIRSCNLHRESKKTSPLSSEP